MQDKGIFLCYTVLVEENDMAKSPTGALYDNGYFQLYPSSVVQEGVWADVISASQINSIWHKDILSPHGDETYHHFPKPLPHFPAYQSGLPILEAAYNLALHELEDNTNNEQTFDTGSQWKGVWTRDVAFAADLGITLASPHCTLASLKSKIKHGVIVQDTGTGGSWPISTDRVAWALAAWDSYLITGDLEWLKEIYIVLSNTLKKDEHILHFQHGLIPGESSFLDWREQSYPAWMSPSDIGNSFSLSTMCIYQQAHYILNLVCKELEKNEEALIWKEKAKAIANTINQHFWLPHKHYYGQYFYGRGYPIISEKCDSLGEAFSILFGIAQGSRADEIVANHPHGYYGVPCFFPHIAGDMPPYHNQSIWPFVEGYYIQTAAKVGNLRALAAGMACLVRASILFGTNKENMVFATGDYHGTALNSSRQLWSIGGMLGMFYKVIFGISYDESSIFFTPSVPKAFQTQHHLSGIRIRKIDLDIHIHGYGNQINRCKINGKDSVPSIKFNRPGLYKIEIELSPSEEIHEEINWVHDTLDIPYPQWIEGSDLKWEAVEDALFYRIFKNGEAISQQEACTFSPQISDSYAQYQVMAVSADGKESFLNEPKEYVPENYRHILSPSKTAVLCSLSENNTLALGSIDIEEPAQYRAELLYSNGTCDQKNGNTCALRSLILDQQRIGSFILPHCSKKPGVWDEFQYSQPLYLNLEAGRHTLSLQLTTHDTNMNRYLNEACIMHLRLTRTTAPIASPPEDPS